MHAWFPDFIYKRKLVYSYSNKIILDLQRFGLLDWLRHWCYHGIDTVYF